MELSLEVDGVDRVLAGLKAAPGIIEAADREAMGKSVFVVEAAVKSRTPRVTGRLFSSINGRTSTIGGLHGSVRTNVHYARYVESGRGPVEAKPGGFLRFRIGGRWVYRKRVGPAAGRFMFREGLAASAGQVKDIFRDAAKRAAELIQRGG